MKLYNSSIVDIKYNVDGNEYEVGAGKVVDIAEHAAKELMKVYGFIIEPTEEQLKKLSKVKKATKIGGAHKVVKKRK